MNSIKVLREVETRQQSPMGISLDEMPEFEWLPINSLRFDDRYQRPLGASNWKAIKKIANKFQWRKFGSVNVARLEDGLYAVVDSQHRVHAANMIGVTHVPCLIYNMTLQEQAEAFAAINGAVIKVTTWSILKAALCAGEKWAIEADKTLAEAGCKLMTNNKPEKMKKPGEIYAVVYIEKLIKAGKAEQLKFALHCLRQSAAGEFKEYYTSLWLKAICEALIERYPRFKHIEQDVIAAISNIDMIKMEDAVDEEFTRQKRLGMAGFSKWEMRRSYFGTALDKRLPAKAISTPS